MTPDRPDETLAPLITGLRYHAYGPRLENYVYTNQQHELVIHLLSEEVNAQRRLSAEKDATIAKLEGYERTHLENLEILRAELAEKDAKLADLKARIEKYEATPWPGCRVLSIGDDCECSLCRSEKTRNGYRIERDEAEHYAKELRAELAEQSATLARLEQELDEAREHEH